VDRKKKKEESVGSEHNTSDRINGESTNSKLKKGIPFYFYIILFCIPVLFFILLEISLRIFEYGYNNNQWIAVTEGKLILNPEIGRRYFYKVQSLPYSNQNVFDELKKENSFRVFVMGGSSAQGFPFAPLGTFSRYLQQRLELVYPDSKIEIVNLGITAVNSYTLRDLFPGVMEQSPDLIIIYAGHNEFYGVLGVGSTESFGTSRTIINLALTLSRFKTFVLLTDMIQEITGLFVSSEPINKDATLMARMVQEQNIPFESELYWKGIQQFEANMRDIFEMSKEKNVNVLLSTLTSNTKDQKPFISVEDKKFPPAEEVFKLAQEKLKNNQIELADSLFTLAKDLDALRFRAPEKINLLIRDFGNKYSYPVVEVDSAFRAFSPSGIVGANLMTDHLHPTLEGYQLMGKTFFDAMKSHNYLPTTKSINLSDEQQDSITLKNFIFSEIDSLQAYYRITALKNDWPYIKPNQRKPLINLLRPKNYIDSLVYKSTIDELNWELLHRQAASYYLLKRDFANYKEQMDILISQFPVIVEYYNSTAYEFLKLGQYDAAYPYLKKRYELVPDAFSTKWLGIIDLSKENNDSAIKFLEESIKFDENDTQVLFNLAGAYARVNDFDKALRIINECLRIEPTYQEAISLKEQLERLQTR
jgi:tetratricopeptide (TPR) repeat protein